VPDSAILFRHVSRRFGPVTALADLDLDVPTGTVFGFLGPNGAGKTTTVRLILGLLAPTAGTVQVLGLDPLRNGEAVRSQCGVVLDQAGLYERLTASENLWLAGRIAQIPAAELRRRIDESLRRVGLWDRRQDRAGTFSKGMRQKLAIARALLTEPRLLVLDEPTSGLDPENIVLVRELLMSLAEEGSRTIFLCTHLLDEAERLCDQVAIIQGGRIQAQGRVDELGGRTGAVVRVRVTRMEAGRVPRLHWPAGVQVDPGEDGEWRIYLSHEEDVEDVVRVLVEAGAGVRAVIPEKESLEAKYLRIVGGNSHD
jgi:ABC-2 type transport system ATP-binding protein